VPEPSKQPSLCELWRCLADTEQSFTELMNTLPYRTIKPIETIETFI
jgi:hypothetical protein